MSTPRRVKPIHGDGSKALTPAPTEIDSLREQHTALLAQNKTLLEERSRDKRAIAALNQTIRFAIENLHAPLAPLVPKPTATPARRKSYWK